MTDHDPEQLRSLAEQTLAQARTAVVGGIVAGAMTGGLFGYAATLMFYSPYQLTLPGLILGALLGIQVGRQRGRALRLQAQQALCQLHIARRLDELGKGR